MMTTNRIATALVSAIHRYYANRSVTHNKEDGKMVLLSGRDMPLQWLIEAVGSGDWDEDNPSTVDVRRSWMQAMVVLNEENANVFDGEAGQVMRVPEYAVYHATSPLAMLRPEPMDWQINRDQHYQHVANVQAELDYIFMLTNHDEEQDWTKRLEVSWVVSGMPPRSTSVGDVISEPGTSRAWLIERFGLEEIRRASSF